MPSGYKKDFNNHSVFIPKFTTSEVNGVEFGGFEMDKYPNSQPSAINQVGTDWYDIAHSGIPGSVPGISKPGVPVWDYITFPQAMIACCNKGKGWHLTSPFERMGAAFLSQKQNTQPHGNNSNTTLINDITYTDEVGILDVHLNAEAPTYYRALPGSGPNTWAHNHNASGIYDLNGLVLEWTMLLMQQQTGYPYVPANLNVTYVGSPYGRGTISGSGSATPTLTCDGLGVNWLKTWTIDEFNTAGYCYIAEGSGMITALNAIPTAGGAGYVAGEDLTITTGGLGASCRIKTVDGSGAVTAVDLITGGGGYTTGAAKVTTGGSGDGNCTVNITTVSAANGGALYPITSNTATTVVLANGAIPTNGTATFVIFKLVNTDITDVVGSSGSKIVSLRNSDADLKAFGLPLLTNATGSAVYGHDAYYYDKLSTSYPNDHAALWGGHFNLSTSAGVFDLSLHVDPSYSFYGVGFRACKAL